MRIYVAGPYSAATVEGREANTMRAMRAGLILMQRGHDPYVPHLSHFLDLEAPQLGLRFTWDDWMMLSNQWLQQCDALLYLGSSRGADMELAWATDWGLKIYRNLLDVPMAGVGEAQNPSNDGLRPTGLRTETEVAIQKLPHAWVGLPAYQTEGAAALDLRAAISDTPQNSIPPGSTVEIPTGLCVAIPSGYAGLILARSGLALRSKVVPVNQPGLIDPDYRGEIILAMHNHGEKTFYFQRGDRLAQLLLVPYERVAWKEVAALEPTKRGDAGWGSTGRQ